ncbi:MAG TPA: hypothetical protein PKE47_12745, partial [Verrucomicrobiota bacterium]|nr:hypothetical protein [Verrucomicrobiota bacterium]
MDVDRAALHDVEAAGGIARAEVARAEISAFDAGADPADRLLRRKAALEEYVALQTILLANAQGGWRRNPPPCGSWRRAA